MVAEKVTCLLLHSKGGLCFFVIACCSLHLNPGMDGIELHDMLWQAKLKEMEAKLKSKEATLYESDGVAAKVARDRQGNFVFQFDQDRYGFHPGDFSPFSGMLT